MPSRAPQEFESTRLFARAICMADEAHLFELLSSPEVMRYVAYGRPLSVAEIQSYVDRKSRGWETDGFGIYLFFCKETRAFVGRGGLQRWDDSGRVELGFALMTPFWGGGYGFEIGRKLAEIAIQNLSLDAVYGTVRSKNLASRRVLEKIGMCEAGVEEYMNEPALVYRLNRETFLKAQT